MAAVVGPVSWLAGTHRRFTLVAFYQPSDERACFLSASVVISFPISEGFSRAGGPTVGTPQDFKLVRMNQ